MSAKAQASTERAAIAPVMGHPISFLANRQFLFLLGGQAITNTTYYLYIVLLTIWAFVLTGSGAAVSVVWAATSLAPFVLGPLAGVFIDRWNRKHVLLVATLVLAATALPPVLAPAALRLPAMFLSALLASASSSFVMPAKSGVLQTVVPEAHQTQAAYWSAATFTLGSVGGAALAAPLYFLVGPFAALEVVAVLFLLATLLWFAMRLSPAAHPDVPSTTVRASLKAVRQDLVHGLRFVVQTHSLQQLWICASLVMGAASMFNAANLVFVVKHLHVPAQAIGPINAAISLGTLVGAFLAGGLVRRIAPMALFAGGILLLGIGVVVYAQVTWYPLAVLWIGLAVVPQSAVDVGLGPILVAASPPDLIGRTQSVIESSMLGAALLATALEGYLVQIIPVAFLIAGAGGLVLLAGIFALLGVLRRPAPQSVVDGQRSPLPEPTTEGVSEEESKPRPQFIPC